ncbi:unnamed protein product, partial [Mesorhabditis belari]|uniref:Uncharacterized protein n=1 Tax=Mesorhabditis belari TaxID=2138241 RepID=A0AAF3FT21_9BILA
MFAASFLISQKRLFEVIMRRSVAWAAPSNITNEAIGMGSASFDCVVENPTKAKESTVAPHPHGLHGFHRFLPSSWVTVGAAVYAGYKLELHKVRYEITYLNGVEISRTVTRGKEILYTFGK